MKRLRSRLLTGVAVVLAASGLGAWTYLRGQHGTHYRTIPVARGDIDSTISATGNPNAVVTVQVGSQVSGNILALYADFNSKVKKDQLIARIDPQSFQAKVDAARAAVESARAQLLNAQAAVQKSIADVASAQANVAVAKHETQKANLTAIDAKSKMDRRIELANEGVLSKEDRETAQATYDEAVSGLQAAQAQEDAAVSALNAAQAEAKIAQTAAEAAGAQVKENQATLQQAEIDLEHTYIKAPVDGTVVSRQVNVGQTVAASLAAPTLFEIAQDLTKMQVDTNVDEADVGRVRVGQAATFTVDAYPSRVFRGAVTDIRKAPINTQNVITYDVVIGVSNDDLKLFPGMTANVKILIDQRENVLKIPNAALRYRPVDGAAPAKDQSAHRHDSQKVWILAADGKPHPVAVELGISDGTWTEVRSGDLLPNQPVVVGTISKETAGASPFGAPTGRRGPGF